MYSTTPQVAFFAGVLAEIALHSRALPGRAFLPVLGGQFLFAVENGMRVSRATTIYSGPTDSAGLSKAGDAAVLVYHYDHAVAIDQQAARQSRRPQLPPPEDLAGIGIERRQLPA